MSRSRTIDGVRLLVFAWLLASAHVTFAGPSQADIAFERGRTLLAAGKYDDACAAFEESLRLDFQYGTLFNIADCNDKRGKLATAHAAWTRIANEDHNQPRAQRARELAAQLEKRVPRIRVALSPPTAATITIDGVAIAGVDVAVLVDLGTHEVVAVVSPGREVRRTVQTPQEGAVVTVTLVVPAANAPAVRPVDRDPPPTTSSSRATTGKIVLVLGAATVATGLVFGGVAMAGWSSAEDTAGTDVAKANEDVDRVELYGNLSTGLIAAGAVTVGIGIYLWRSGSHQPRPVAAVGPGGGSIGIAGAF